MRRVNGGVTTTLVAPPAAATATAPDHPRAQGDSPWRQRAALAVLLVATAVMYLWNITVNGMGNQFYAGAAQAGSRNWEALLFGSLDPNNFITVDKPPVSQWVMGLSGQIFGFSSASMLIPRGADGGRRRRAAVRRGAPDQRTARGAAGGRGAGADAGGGVDVSLQQPRRGDGAADDGGRLLRGARAASGPARRGSRWPEWRWASRSWPRCSRASW